jgi:hypothetical protein
MDAPAPLRRATRATTVRTGAVATAAPKSSENARVSVPV